MSVQTKQTRPTPTTGGVVTRAAHRRRRAESESAGEHGAGTISLPKNKIVFDPKQASLNSVRARLLFANKRST